MVSVYLAALKCTSPSFRAKMRTLFCCGGNVVVVVIVGRGIGEMVTNILTHTYSHTRAHTHHHHYRHYQCVGVWTIQHEGR